MAKITPSAGHIARSTGIVMVAFVASKGVGLLRDTLIVRGFGTSGALDSYYAAFQIPDLLFTLIAGGALATAFIPVFAEVLAKEDREAAWRLASAITNLTVIVTAILAALGALFAPQLVARVIAPGFGLEQQALTAQLMRVILISTLLFAISGIQMGILNAFQHFLLPAVAPIAYNLGIIAGALVARTRPDLPPEQQVRFLAYGVIFGAFLHLMVKLPGLIHYGLRWQPILGLNSPEVRQVARLMGPRMLALGVIQINMLVNTNLASRLDTGSVSALRIAYLIQQLPETVFATALATAVFPTLAELASRGQKEELRTTLFSTLRVILALTVPATLGLILLGRPAIEAVFQRGALAFTGRSTDAVYFALIFYALGLVGQSMLEVVARVFYAQKDTQTPLLVAVGSMLLNIVLSLALLGPLQHGGLALSNSIAITVEMGVLLWLSRRSLGMFERGTTLTTLWQIGGATILMSLAILATNMLLANRGPILVTLVGAIVGSVVYVGAATLLGAEELRLVFSLVRGRLRRAPA